jgi:VWFA-related protein
LKEEDTMRGFSTIGPWRGVIGGIVVVGMLIAVGVGAQEATQSETDTKPSPQTPVFRDEVAVNVVNVFVTVVGRDRQPVAGLTVADFTVIEDGKPVEITNFSEMGASGVVTLSDDTASAGATGASPTSGVVADSLSQPSLMALVFDNTSLEKRQRKRVLKSIDGWLDTVTGDKGRVMVASLNPELEIVQPFTSDAATVRAALERVADEPSYGNVLKNNKRMLVRSMQSASSMGTQVIGMPGAYDTPGSGGSGGSSGSGGSGGSGGGSGGGDQGGSAVPGYTGVRVEDSTVVGSAHAKQFLAQIDMHRLSEYSRVGMTLAGVDRLVRGMSGLAGRKDVLWIGEDIMLRPALDVYQVYHTKFGEMSRDYAVDPPEIWSNELELTEQFKRVAQSAQVANTVLHVVDASDRDREMASADFKAPDAQTFMSTDPIGVGASGGYGLSQSLGLTEGSQYLAGATGGSFLGGTRNYDPYFETLGNLVSSYYSIGYKRPGPPDGQFHWLEVEVSGSGLRVRSHERVGNPTPDQRLADLAVSRLLIGEGPNPLGLRVEFGSSEPADGGKTLQELAIMIPAGNLDLAAIDDSYVGRITIVLLATDAKGNPTPPRIVQLDLNIPSSHYSPAAVARSRLRLLMEPESQGLALAVRDEGSGVTASAMVSAKL